MKIKFTFSHPVHLSKNSTNITEIVYDRSVPKNTHNTEIQDWLHILNAGITKLPRNEMDWIKIEKIKE